MPKKPAYWPRVLCTATLVTCALVAAQERSAQKNSREPIIGKSDRRASSAEALVTGDPEALQGAVAGYAPTLKFYFTPRPPLSGTEPSLAYPPGWNIEGQKLTVSRGGFTSAWIAQIEGWDPRQDGDPLLRAFQDKIDADGFKGENASPPNGGCDLVYPANTAFSCVKVCVGGPNAGTACASQGCVGGGICTDPCPAMLGENGPKCGNTVAGYCDWGWQNICGADVSCLPPHRSDWVMASNQLADQTAAVNIVSTTGPNFAATTTSGSEIFDGGIRYYTGTLILPVPACARGTYTIAHKIDQTFAYPGFLGGTFPVAAFVTGVLEIPIGSCCTDFSDPSTGTCTAGVTVAECNALPSANLQVFRPDIDCNTPCDVECVDNTDCDDNLFCNGIETCTATRCQPAQPPCASYEACNETAQVCTLPRIPTMSQWGIAALTLILLIAAKIGFQRRMEPSN